MGDQYNDMGTVSLQVDYLWRQYLSDLSKVVSITCLVGNHDMTGDGIYNAMASHGSKNIQVVGDSPSIVSHPERQNGIVYPNPVYAIGFIRNSDQFVASVNAAVTDSSILLCHQEFEGSQYENGFYAPHGVLPSAIRSKMIISGHIHMAQSFANVTYVGAPRYINRSDCNTSKYIWVLDSDLCRLEPVSPPEGVLVKYRSIIIKEGGSVPDIDNSAYVKNFIDIYGSDTYIQKTLRLVPEGSVIRTFPNKVQAQTTVSENKGVKASMEDYLVKFCEDKGVDKPLAKIISERVRSVCPTVFR
jgi:hypothetical protein